MSSTPSGEAVLTVTTPATPSPSLKAFDFDFTGSNYEMDASISDEERRFYLKMYPTVDVVNQRKVHCTVCRMHIGTAASADSNIKMHPILRVTHCIKCHDFYNSGEFSKGEDGSELYCRWCGQGGEVYCCSTCPFVFCKSCIIKNLSRGVIVDIEQNENWNCFKCTSKILWPLRAQHWALVNYIQTQKNGLQSMQLSESEMRRHMHKDYSTCCRLAKAKANSLSDSMESLESNASKRSHASSVHSVKKSPKPQCPPAKRPKSSNDEVVCTPDLLSMLEPDCQISVAQKPGPRPTITPAASITTTTPRIVTVQQNYSGPSPSTNGSATTGPRSSLPPPLVLSSSGMRYRQATPGPASVVRRTVVPNAVRTAGPVFHTINGFRVDLNSAAQQDSYRLPNGRLIQVKRQLPPSGQPATTVARTPISMNPQVIIRQQTPGGPSPRVVHPSFGSNMGIYNPQTNQQQRAPQVVRVNNGSQVHSVNVAAASTPSNSNGGTTIMMTPAAVHKAPTLVRHVFPNSPIGMARTQLQEQIFNAMEICTHLTGKVQTLTHSNAYNQARSYMDLKELYIHLSYLMTYAIGRFKQLQDKCLVDMREMGFKNDANSLENGQLAAEKQASDDEDNEIEIVEPKTDTITIDSDNEEELPSVSNVSIPKGLKITSVKSTAPASNIIKIDPVTANMDPNMDIDVAAFSSSILASLLEVDITEGVGEVKTHQATSPGGTIQKKQPRKKMTNKPNPALLHLERQRMEETKRNDAKLKMKVVVKLRRAEEDFEVARKWMDMEHAKKLAKKSTVFESQPNAEEQMQKAESQNEPVEAAIDANKEEESDNTMQNDSEKEQEQHVEDELLQKMDTTDATNSQTDVENIETKSTSQKKAEDADNPEDIEISAADKEKTETEPIKTSIAKSTEGLEVTESAGIMKNKKSNEATMEVTEIIEADDEKIELNETETDTTAGVTTEEADEAEDEESMPQLKYREADQTALDEAVIKSGVAASAKTDAAAPAAEANEDNTAAKAADTSETDADETDATACKESSRNSSPVTAAEATAQAKNDSTTYHKLVQASEAEQPTEITTQSSPSKASPPASPSVEHLDPPSDTTDAAI
ncbi:uncharacterized protein Dvir_GJ17920, isoform B [Drosophila virilis]|uniref:Uncharacterized protein, isoform B n=1 Tax=Drosophila virilis TaxID=7244 RepID=A0A0Q9W0U6_DROVI|nr:uncharacterized protein Dvir_GJ17920, isoform B [Drosophila virilis]